MADVLINGNSMQDIGDAIREKLRVSDTYTPAEMPAAIRAISGTLPGIGYTGSDLILRDANGDISGVWYVDGEGNWVEYTTGGGGGDSGHSFGPTVINATSVIFNTTSYEEVPVE